MKKILILLFAVSLAMLSEASIRQETSEFQYIGKVAFSNKVVVGYYDATNNVFNSNDFPVVFSVFGKDGVIFPAGTSEQRPAGITGYPVLRYNTASNWFEYRFGTNGGWSSLVNNATLDVVASNLNSVSNDLYNTISNVSSISNVLDNTISNVSSISNVLDNTISNVSSISNDLDTAELNIATLIDEVYYILPTVSYVSGGTTYHELGSNVPSVNLSFVVNKTMINRTYSGGYAEVLGAGSSHTYMNTNAVSFTNVTTKSFVITVVDIRTNYAAATRTLSFKNRVYYGVLTNEFNTVANGTILGLTSTWETLGHTGIEVGSSQYIYVAYPSRLGACSSFTMGGLPSSAWTNNIRNITNNNSVVESFYIYHCDNKQNGSMAYDIH